MAKLSVKPGSTSVLLRIFLADSSSTTGAGLTGLTSGSSGLVCYRARDDDGNAGGTAISLSGGTKGTWSSGGLVEKDATNLPGVYEFGIPNAAIAAGSRSVLVMFKGATNLAPCLLEIDLDSQVDVTSWNGTAVSSPATAGIPDVNVKNVNNAAANNQLTIAQIATGVWTDTTAGDFTTSLSVGKSLLNGVTLGTGLTINALADNSVTAAALAADAGTEIGAAVLAAAATAPIAANVKKVNGTTINGAGTSGSPWGP